VGKRKENVGIFMFGNLIGGNDIRGNRITGKRTARRFFPNDDASFFMRASNHGKKSLAHCRIRLGLPSFFALDVCVDFSRNQLTDP